MNRYTIIWPFVDDQHLRNNRPTNVIAESYDTVWNEHRSDVRVINFTKDGETILSLFWTPYAIECEPYEPPAEV